MGKDVGSNGRIQFILRFMCACGNRGHAKHGGQSDGTESPKIASWYHLDSPTCGAPITASMS